jgi:hypothetical protein
MQARGATVYETVYEPALHAAAKDGSVDDVTALLAAGADVNAKNKYGRTALHVAAYNERVDVFTAILRSGAAVDVQDKWGWTALHFAVMYGNADSLKALVHAGADMDMQNANGTTALHLAAVIGDVDCMKVLLVSGAAMHVHEKNGNTALVLAKGNRYTNCVEVLTSLSMRRTNVLARVARFSVSGLHDTDEAGMATAGLYESLFERVLRAVESRRALSECRLVCKTWRNVSDDTLFEMPVEFFAPAATM